MYDKSESVPGCSVLRERRFNRDAFSFPEVVVVEATDLEFEFRIYYEGEEEFRQQFRLHIDDSPEIEILIWTERQQAKLGLRLVDLDDPPGFDDGQDDDGRFGSPVSWIIHAAYSITRVFRRSNSHSKVYSAPSIVTMNATRSPLTQSACTNPAIDSPGWSVLRFRYPICRTSCSR